MTKRLITLLLLLGSLVSGQIALAAAFELPADVQKLMPAEPTAVMAVSSVNELLDRYTTISNTLDEGRNEGPTREVMLADLEKALPGFGAEVDFDRPLFVVAGLPDMMGGGPPPFMLIVPLRDAAAGTDALAIAAKFPTFFREGSYVAGVSDGIMVPGDGAPDLATHLPAGVISATLDLTDIITNFRPFIEMGLAGMPIRDESVDADNTTGMTAAEAAALTGALRSALDSVTRLDLGFGYDGDLITMHTGLGIAPGSALDPGPQPDFARAQALAAALPQDADFLQVIALDQTRIFESFRDYYLLTMKSAVSGMDADQAAGYNAWVEDYIAHMDMWANPMAAALKLTDDGMAAHLVMETDDAEATLAHLTTTLGGMNDLGIGYNLTRNEDRKVAGVNFQVWDVAIDLEQFESVMPAHGETALSGTERMQAEQVVTILQRILPVVYLGAKDDKLYMASSEDTETLAALVKRAGKKGHPVAALARIAKQAGPGCQQVITGDLLAIINWVSDMVAEMQADEAAVIADHPIPFQADVVIDGADIGFDMGMDLVSLAGLVQAMEELEAINKDEGAAGDE